MSTDKPAVESRSIKQVFERKLTIPEYQRPYTWKVEHVEKLLEDIYRQQQEKPTVPYILGSIILESDNIVDGQQRLTTIRLVLQSLSKEQHALLSSQSYPHTLSHYNIKNNFIFIQKWIEQKLIGKVTKNTFYDYLCKNVYFVIVNACSQDQAFTFFNSQNARGKPLEPHDLLKAHHLRFVCVKDQEELATNCAKEWEKIESTRLSLLLDDILGQSRKWMRKEYDSLDLILEFKSQRYTSDEDTVYTTSNYNQPPVFTSWEYIHSDKNNPPHLKLALNEGVDLRIGTNSLQLHSNTIQFMPFQMGQAIDGGEHFFWYVQKYDQLYSRLFEQNTEEEKHVEIRNRLNDLSGYASVRRIRDTFVALTIFYYDKFGNVREDISRDFLIALSFLLLRQKSITKKSINKYNREDINIFNIINQASNHNYISKEIHSFMMKTNWNTVSMEEGKGMRGLYSKIMAGLFNGKGEPS